MGKNVAEKILEKHVVERRENEIGIKIDQTLTQDATGTMAYLQFEALDIPKVKTELSVSYVDHNTLQTDFKNPDDHLYLQSVASKYGIILSKAGNGICHQVHLERFARPGKTLLGSDSHTSTAGGAGSLAIGAGGLDVAIAMAGGAFYLKKPKVVGVKLTGKLPQMVAAKDVILEVLRRIGVKGGVNKVLEYCGEGVKSLSVPERATITNMGAETGATSSVFPSDKITKAFLKSQGREAQWIELVPDSDAEYDESIEIDLSKLEPLIAKPHSPGNVVTVKELEGMGIQQVAIGSCTNSSYKDLMTAARILKGKKVHPNVSLVISPGSRTVFNEIAKNGALADLIASGARILECTCGPCIGQGQAPPTNGVSIRTFNRNFEGRSGTKSAQVYLTSVETATVTAIEGKLTDPRKHAPPEFSIPTVFHPDDTLIIYPSKTPENVKIIRGPNIAPLPKKEKLPGRLAGEVLIKVGDDITTDHIMPAGKLLPLRSNVPEYAKHVFEPIDPNFAARALEKKGGFILGGSNYGQGSSREHAALCPMYLGVKAVIAKSFARIHLANLINFGILPLELKNPDDYDKIDPGDSLELDVSDLGKKDIALKSLTKKIDVPATHPLTPRDIDILKEGGLLSFTKTHQN
ncbi:MAG: aconitate hydratase [Thermoplasmatales archaeon]|nr:aconitate hydratase [Thermoplasmatales archaeon]